MVVLENGLRTPRTVGRQQWIQMKKSASDTIHTVNKNCYNKRLHDDLIIKYT